ncbi:MAG: MltA domain-containing protein [Acidobacteriota bacterium]
MKKKNIIIIILILLLVCVSGWLLLKKKEVQWTSENSLNSSELIISSDTGNIDDLITAIDQSLLYYSKIDPETEFSFGKKWCSASDMRLCLEDFKEKITRFGLSEKFFEYLNKNYAIFRSASDEFLLTGYFEASLSGSREKDEEFRFPVYKKPDDLVQILLSEFTLFSKAKGLPFILRGRLDEDNKITPYFSRGEIDENKMLANRGLELLWVNDNIDLFFLHIQGSALVNLSNNEEIRINYADTNGHPYRAIGKVLVEKGICEYKDLSMQYIEKYLREHPAEVNDIFNYNPSYIFFREVDDGPVGSLGVNVTKYRSIATDKYIFPKGAICYIETSLPDFDKNWNGSGEKKFSAFVLNQDTGGAIRSPSRADLFTGNGENSELVAGHLKSNGSLYFLIKKSLLKLKKNKKKGRP